MIRPVQGVVTITSNYKQHIRSGRFPGVDYINTDKKVRAAFDGTVQTGYDAKIKGYYVYINSTSHRYLVLCSHLKKGTVKVKNGDKVKTGDLLGIMGDTGNAKGVHVHVSLWKDGQLVNPERYFPPYMSYRKLYSPIKKMTPRLIRTSVRHIPSNVPIRRNGNKVYINAGRKLDIKEYTTWSNGKRFYRTANAVTKRLQQGFGKSRLGLV